MARKVLDIMPPYHKEAHHHPGLKKKKEKRKALMVFVLIIIFLFIFLFIAGLFNLEKTANSPKVGSQNSASNFELFNEQGQSNLIAGQTATSIRLLDGSPNADSLRTARDLLLKNGYEIEKTDQAASKSSQTIIYYPPINLQQAQKIAAFLKSYNPKLQESQANSNYDILILVGG
jgi:hypothetical protein